MLKYIALMALAVTIAMPAMAEESAGQNHPQGPSLQEIKAKHAEHYQQMKQEQNARRAAMDKHMDDCNSKVQGANSPEEIRSIMDKCHEEGKAMHEANKEKREEAREQRQEQREERRDERQERHEQHQENHPAAE